MGSQRWKKGPDVAEWERKGPGQKNHQAEPKRRDGTGKNVGNKKEGAKGSKKRAKKPEPSR